MLIEMFKMKSAEQNEKCWTKLLVGKKCFISNLLIKNAERRENGVKARVIKTDAARISTAQLTPTAAEFSLNPASQPPAHQQPDKLILSKSANPNDWIPIL